MNFDWNEQQKKRYETVKKEVERVLGSVPFDRSQSPFSRDRWQGIAEVGLLGLCVPEDLGGQGLDLLSTAYAVEAFGSACDDIGHVFAAAAHLFACVAPIADHAGDDVRDRLVARLCSGEWVGANAITEDEAGSDIAALQTTAVRDGDSYVLEGTKSFVSNGPVADVFVTYATVDPAFGPLGVSAFVVERSRDGVVVGEPFEKMGLEGCLAGRVSFERCRIPAEQRLGAEGEGLAIFQASMRYERACLFAAYLGAMERVLERCLEHARSRRQGGRSIGSYQAVSHRLVDMKLRLEAARLLLYRACWRLDQGDEATLDVSLSKLAVSEAALASSLDAVRIFGGRGYAAADGIEAALRDAVPSVLFSGTSDMQREIVARELAL